jgi:hypothetical protein
MNKKTIQLMALIYAFTFNAQSVQYPKIAQMPIFAEIIEQPGEEKNNIEKIKPLRHFGKGGTDRQDEEVYLETKGLQALKKYLGENADQNITFSDVAPLYQQVKFFDDLMEGRELSNEEKAGFIQRGENYLHLARQFPQYFKKVLDGDQQANENFMNLYDVLLKLVKKEKSRPQNAPDIQLFQSEDPQFIKGYQDISHQLSLGEILKLKIAQAMPSIKEMAYNWMPLPAKLQSKISWEKKDRVNQYVDKVLKTVLNDRFSQKMSNRYPDFYGEAMLKGFAKQFYDLHENDLLVAHNPFKYWAKARIKDAINSVKSKIREIVKE